MRRMSDEGVGLGHEGLEVGQAEIGGALAELVLRIVLRRMAAVGGPDQPAAEVVVGLRLRRRAALTTAALARRSAKVVPARGDGGLVSRGGRLAALAGLHGRGAVVAGRQGERRAGDGAE